MMKRLIQALNVCALLVLFLSCLSCYIDPTIAWPLSFLGLAFPFIIAVIVVLAVFWILWRSRFLWINLFALLLCFPFIRTIVGFHFSRSEEKGIKVMSYNVRNFDLYNWSGNSKTRSAMMDLIYKENADIICFQEFYTDGADFKNMEYLRDTLGYKYHYLHVTYDLAGGVPEKHIGYQMFWGLAIFSKYEITDTGTVSFGEEIDNSCTYADLNVKGKDLRVYNAHLQSIRLDDEDYDALEEIRTNLSTNSYRLRHIFDKMKLAFVKRGDQAETLHKHIIQYKGRKILCGDFNDAPVSYTYHHLSSGLQDAFVQKGRGLGQTYVSRLGYFRIDCILTDPSITINSYKTIHKALSDHYPGVVSLSL